MGRVHDLPACHRAGPFAGNFGQRDQAHARILAALGVVGRRRRHAVRPLRGAELHGVVKGLDRKCFRRRVAADLIEREQAVIAIERGVLQRLRHHRTGELLQLQGKAPHTRRAVRCPARLDQVHGQGIAKKVEDALVCGEPFRACFLDRLARSARGRERLDPRASDRCDRPENAGYRVRAPAAGCRPKSRGWSNVRRRCARAAADSTVNSLVSRVSSTRRLASFRTGASRGGWLLICRHTSSSGSRPLPSTSTCVMALSHS